MDNMIKMTYNTLNRIRDNWDEEFSGTGLIVYDSKVLKKLHYCALRPSIKCAKELKLGDPKLSDYLLEIGNYNHTLHDGFHMVNEKGVLTHVAQYFVPNIDHSIYPDQNHGTRVHCSILSSLVEGVILIGTITLDKSIYIFKNGESIKFDNQINSQTAL